MKFNYVFHLGKYVLFLKGMFSKPDKWPVFFRRVMDEMNNIGIGSLPIVAIISIFIGAVTTVQTAYQLVVSYIPMSVIGQIVSDSTILELSPTIMSLVLAGKVGSHIASEVGTMRVTEQIDALDVMGINAAGYLILPKIIAGMFMFPMLNVVSIVLSIWGGITAGDLSGILTQDQFLEGARETFSGFVVFFSILKAFTFSIIITSISAYQGFYTKGGALEVGKASTRAVVFSCVVILFADYVLAQLLLK
jgi:phospholipid/cholesterol/gamma-HCH transport system permease protein